MDLHGRTISKLMNRAKCLAAFASVVETYDYPSERKAFVMALYTKQVISHEATELLIEHFHLEAA